MATSKLSIISAMIYAAASMVCLASTALVKPPYVIVEADGAKRLPLKAHAAHEPVIPPEANQTILVVGASGFGRPMYETVHRAPLAAQALGVPEDTVVTPALWARFLEHEHLHTRVLVNQADLPQGRELARRLAAGLCCPVCAAALQKEWIECLS